MEYPTYAIFERDDWRFVVQWEWRTLCDCVSLEVAKQYIEEHKKRKETNLNLVYSE
jgi:hypothetical protein